MHRIRLLLIAIASFFGAIIGEGLVRRAIALLMCGVLSFSSTTCYGYFINHDQVNATQPLPLTNFNKNQRNSINSTPNLSPAKEPQLIADIPRIRKPELDLPLDIRIVRQIPYKSGKREIQFVSPSSGIEQVYFTSLPDAEKFELFGIEFKKVGNIDLSPLLVGKDIQFNPSEIQFLLQEFKINFKDNSLSKVVLADGTTAEFSQSQAIIKSPKGQELERVQLSQVKSFSKRIFGQEPENVKNLKENTQEKDDNTSSIFISQASSSCQNSTAAQLQNSASTMAQQENQLISNSSKYSLSVGAALNYANSSLKSSVIPKELTQTVCTPPVKCNEQVISGGSEIRTDLFQIEQGANRQVTLEYEFYEVPDEFEMTFDGAKVPGGSIPPTSGHGTKTFSFPNDAKYVGVKLIGNQEIKTTKWWYKVACSGEGEELLPLAYPNKFGTPEYYAFRHNDFKKRNPGIEAPDYYLDFGKNNLEMFMNKTRPKLTEQGKIFLETVAPELQRRIENLLISRPKTFAWLERRPFLFRQFAYVTHVGAYCSSGWEKLPQRDRNTIISDISFSDKYGSLVGILTGLTTTIKCGSWRDAAPDWFPNWNDIKDLIL